MTNPSPPARTAITFRRLTDADVPFGMALCAQAGWNQTDADWRRMLSLAPETCHLAEVDGEPAGTVVAMTFGRVAWVAMVLVDGAHRGRGVGTALMEHVLADLDARGVPSVRLDATPLGEPIYRKLGFVEDFRLVRLQRAASAPPLGKRALSAANVRITPVTRADLDTLATLDHAVTHTDRRPLLDRLLSEFPDHAWLAHRDDRPIGYLLARPGANALHIGPAVADDHTVGIALLDHARHGLHSHSAFIDVPTANAAVVDHLATLGFSEQRPYTRMTRGAPVCEHVPHLIASSGPEKG